MKQIKITMVGGGSYNWCPHLLSDLMKTPELEGAVIYLLDINPVAAHEMEQAMNYQAGKQGLNFTFIATGDEELAFRNADFVVITISTGGLAMHGKDLEIPLRYGIQHTVGDSAGPGGWSRLLRNIPVFAEMARKIERLSPDAVVLNYSNPMAGLTAVISQVSGLRNVGLCHGLFGTYWMLERLLEVEEKDLSIRFGGINHFFWIWDLNVRGKDGYRMIRKKMDGCSLDEALDRSKSTLPPRGIDHLLCEELFREYGCFTYYEDRHTCEYLPGYLNPELLKRYHIDVTTIKEREEKLKKNRTFTLELASGKKELPERTRETMVDYIKSFVTNTPFVDVVNLPNIGQIDNLPRGAVVETLGTASAVGFTPLAVGNVPEPLRSLLERHCIIQQMTVEAGLKSNRELALQALSMDPACAHLALADIRKMGMELLDANRNYLPEQFFH